MIAGIGTDIAEVARVRRAIERHGEKVLHRVFTDREIEYANLKTDPYQKFAGRFAVKEAAFKALGTGFTSWHDVEVVNDPSGKPTISLSGRAAARADELGVTRSHASISDTEDLAVAVVILET